MKLIINEELNEDMPEELIAGNSPATDPFAAGTEGQSGENTSTTEGGETKTGLTDTERQELENLRSKVGDIETELDKSRQFFENLSPLFDKLDSQPELIQAILEGKIDSNLARSVMEGKINLDTAQQVSQAHAEIKKEIGKAAYEKMSPEELEQRLVTRLSDVVDQKITEKVSKVEEQVKQTIDDSEQVRQYENSLREFAANTPDFYDYADAIWEWFEKNPDQHRIDIAYEAVKGKKLMEEAAKKTETEAAEQAKNIALNVNMGGSRAAAIATSPELVDQLIASTPNPNVITRIRKTV